MKKFIFPIILLATLSSCSTKPELRADIKEFVTNFSLKKAMDTYKKGGYVKEVEAIEDGKVNLEVTEMEFSYLDGTHPSYSKTTTKYVDEIEVEKIEEEFVVMDDKYYLFTNGELKESSLDECSGLIRNFFYTKTQIEGEYHVQGMYYGDYILQVAPVLQEFITIDQENELYLFEYEVDVVRDGVTVTCGQSYSVNKLGMLIENHVIGYKDNVLRKTDIVVHD